MTITEFHTTDIVLAASLRVHNYSMTSIERNGNKGTFIFADVEEDFISKFDLGNVQVEPIMFNNAIKQLTTSVRRMG